MDMKVILPIKLRDKAESGEKLNLIEVIPGVVYGPKQVPQMVVVERKEFEKIFKTAGESTVLTLEGLSKSMDVLVKDVTFSPIKGGIRHVDFYALEKGKELSTHVPLNFIGEAPAAKQGAVINKVLHEVNVTCQAADLPAHIDVDLTLLTESDGKIKISDIVCPQGVKITEDGEDIVAVAEMIEEVAEDKVEVEAVTEVADTASE